MKQMCALVVALAGAFCGVAHAQSPARPPAADKRPVVIMRKHRPMVIEALIQRDQPPGSSQETTDFPHEQIVSVLTIALRSRQQPAA